MSEKWEFISDAVHASKGFIRLQSSRGLVHFSAATGMPQLLRQPSAYSGRAFQADPQAADVHGSMVWSG